ncbi:DUF2849 domain-containing protein [Pseudovibrio sp. SPO723]|uniref:DUF2849 domain-containing protein n=1 Tax=Nesiotobacter zosterae TaxID=392721 RepID=UPI0029C537E4|nr:DUF2849 domain-containing protein [Pseudovibrio sp. SPO723]MDX5592452.1 DUF2849 domain-containing protein [Pseudovibrio sp. SPO723]
MKIITANRLLDGEVVWLGPQDTWVETVGEARVFEDTEELKAVLGSKVVSEERQEVVGVYEIEVEPKDGSIVPTKLREAIRALGPTTHPAFGKQARAGGQAA